MPVRVNVKHFSLPARGFLWMLASAAGFGAAAFLPSTQQPQGWERPSPLHGAIPAPKDSAVTDAEEQRNDERVPAQ